MRINKKKKNKIRKKSEKYIPYFVVVVVAVVVIIICTQFIHKQNTENIAQGDQISNILSCKHSWYDHFEVSAITDALSLVIIFEMRYYVLLYGRFVVFY